MMILIVMTIMIMTIQSPKTLYKTLKTIKIEKDIQEPKTSNKSSNKYQFNIKYSMSNIKTTYIT